MIRVTLMVALPLVAGVSLFWVLRYIPLQPLVALVYAGLLFSGLGVLNVISPWRILLINNRWMALAVLGGGLLLMAIGMLWPTREYSSAKSGHIIDGFMPNYAFFEHHQVEVKAGAEEVMTAARQVSLVDIPWAYRLMKLRNWLGGGEMPAAMKKPILAMVADPRSGFVVLDGECESEFVGGMAGRPWSSDSPPAVKTAAEFLAFNEPGNIRVVFNLRVEAVSSVLTRLITETRIQGSDGPAKRLFACYWRLIYPGSAIIRILWLDAIRERAIK